MRQLLTPLEVVGGLLLLFGLMIGIFVARRQFLARNAAAFDCSLRKTIPRQRGGWTLGLARYEQDRLEWFRLFTLDPRPGRVLQRGQLSLLDWRPPADGEIDSILPGSVVARCSYDEEILELAMTRSDYTGFSTWMESAPPGAQPFTN